MSMLSKKKTGNDIVVESYNIFLNSDDGKSNGQNYDFQLGNNSINTRGQGQYIRLSLLNFNMYKTWTDVNPNNNGLVLRSSAGTINYPLNVNDYNYATVRDLALNLSAKFKSVIDGSPFSAIFGVTSVNPVSVLPAPGTGINGTTDNIIGFTLTTTNPHGLTAGDLTNGNFALQSLINPSALPGGITGIAEGGDSGLLFGVDRLTANDLFSSFNIDVTTNPNEISILGKYPAQRSTEPNVYIRVNPSPQVYATEAFNRPLDTTGENQLNPSSILAEIRIDTEMVQYEPSNDRQYFANMYQKTMSHLQMALTDSRNRALPLFGTTQDTLGNRHFTATIRVDIIQDTAYGESDAIIPESAYVKSNLPARFDSAVLINQKNGRPGYGTPMGF